jgi:hypothetical protein
MTFARAAVVITAGLLLGQQPPQPPPPESEATGVFRLPSRMPDEPKLAEAPKEETGPPVMKNEGKPMGIPFQCTDQDIQAFGMSCSSDHPCPIYLELSGIQGVGERIFLAGNLHDGSATMYSVMLGSQDGGLTWTEPVERYRNSGLDQVQFFDFETGWVSGQTLAALPRDPFFLLTTDGGKTWRKREIFSESKVGAIDHFLFDSRTAGGVVIDRRLSGSNSRYERYETMTGGESWMVREVNSQPLKLKATRPPAPSPWRIRADAKLNAHIIEKQTGKQWTRVAAFLVSAGDCKPAESELVEPPPPPETPSTAAPPPSRPRPAPSSKPSLRKK